MFDLAICGGGAKVVRPNDLISYPQKHELRRFNAKINLVVRKNKN